MSFPEYLKERLSVDYRNLIIQKLEEVKQQSENLKDSFPRSTSTGDDDFHGKLESELGRLRETIDSEIKRIQESMQGQISLAIDDYVTSWYHSDISAFQQQLEILISDIVSNVPAPPKKESGDVASLCDLIEKLETAGTQSEILGIVLKHISNWVNRAVLFVVKGDTASGWAAFGLGPDLDASKIKQLSISLHQNHILREVVHTNAPAYGSAEKFSDNSELYFHLGGDFPKSALAFPISVRGKIAGILYTDLSEDLSEQPDLPNLLNLACKSASMAIDLLPVRPKAPAKPAPTPPPPASPEPEPPPPPPPPVEVQPTKPEVGGYEVPTVEMNARPFREEAGDAGTTVVMPTPPLPPPVVVSSEDQKLHEDAKRFARLLVSEIKLYNEAQVSAGREKKDLYERLKDDIERSRRMYLERVPEHIHTTTNYFYEELVRTLANGDPTLLGM